MNQDEYFKKLVHQFLNYTLNDHSLSYVISEYLKYYSLTNCVDENKVRWLNFDNLENVIEQFLKQLFNDFYQSNQEFYEFLNSKAKSYEKKLNKKENEIMSANIEPFYGDESFLKHRIIYATSKILSNITKDEIPENIKEKFNNFYDILKKYIEDLDYLNMNGDYQYQKNIYDILESYYKQLISIEINLSQDLEEIWNKKISSTTLCGIAHGFSGGEFMPWEASKVCTTYFDENYITIYGEYGYLYPMNMKICDIICSTDAGSYFVNKKEFIKNIETWWQKNNPLYSHALTYNTNKTMFYAQPNYSKLALFDDVLKENYNLALKNNLICETNLPFGFGYNEIVFLDENKNIKPIGVWVKKGSDEICQKAKQLANKLNLPLTIIDIKKCKEEYQKKLK